MAVGVTSRTQVSNSLLCNFIGSRIASSNIGLSQASRRSTLEYKAMIHCVLVQPSLCRVDPRCGRAIVATGGSKDDLV